MGTNTGGCLLGVMEAIDGAKRVLAGSPPLSSLCTHHGKHRSKMATKEIKTPLLRGREIGQNRCIIFFLELVSPHGITIIVKFGPLEE